MAFIYDATLTVNSVIDNLNDSGLPDGDPEINIFTTKGKFKYTDDAAEISYTEEGENGKTFCTVKASSENTVRLSRHGAVDLEAILKEGEEIKTLYTVSPYSFDMSIKPLKIRNSLGNDGGELSLFYLMNIGGQDKKVKMKISVKVL